MSKLRGHFHQTVEMIHKWSDFGSVCLLFASDCGRTLFYVQYGYEETGHDSWTALLMFICHERWVVYYENVYECINDSMPTMLLFLYYVLWRLCRLQMTSNKKKKKIQCKFKGNASQLSIGQWAIRAYSDMCLCVCVCFSFHFLKWTTIRGCCL